MMRLLALLSLVASPVGAQEIAFAPDATEACLAEASDVYGQEACIGDSAQACIDTPDGYTTVGMGFCLSAEASYWDERLNTAFRALLRSESELMEEMEKIGSSVPDTAKALRDMQRTWIGFRDASCAYEHATWGGGSGGGPAYAGCLMDKTGRQALVLEQRLRDRAN